MGHVEGSDAQQRRKEIPVITDFLKTKRNKEELKHALEVLREFKECESAEERAMMPFAAWSKLNQMEEFIAYIVEGV